MRDRKKKEKERKCERKREIKRTSRSETLGTFHPENKIQIPESSF